MFHTRIRRMRGMPYSYGCMSYAYEHKHVFFKSDTRMSKLIHVWAENSELAFGFFKKVVALDVSFHFTPVPCYSELQRSRYDQNTTRLSWCKTCWKLDFVKCSENSSRSFSGHLFDFHQTTKHVKLPKKIKSTINN